LTLYNNIHGDNNTNNDIVTALCNLLQLDGNSKKQITESLYNNETMEKTVSNNIDSKLLINYGIFYCYNIFNNNYITFLFYSF